MKYGSSKSVSNTMFAANYSHCLDLAQLTSLNTSNKTQNIISKLYFRNGMFVAPFHKEPIPSAGTVS